MWLSESFKGVDLENSLVIAGVAYPLRIRRHARARSFRLSVDSAKREVRLGLPTRASLHKALQWVRGQEAWLEKQLAELPDGIALVQGAVFPFEGSDVRIDWSPLAARRVMLGDGCLMLGGAEEAIASRVLRWLRDRARETLHHETEVYAARAGMQLGQVSVGDPRSRWGSCASNGNIRYSWRLICAPIFVRRATVAHEVAHLAHMDHSPAFHARHADIYGGDPVPARQWLREHGAMLHRIGASKGDVGTGSPR